MVAIAVATNAAFAVLAKDASLALPFGCFGSMVTGVEATWLLLSSSWLSIMAATEAAAEVVAEAELLAMVTRVSFVVVVAT